MMAGARQRRIVGGVMLALCVVARVHAPAAAFGDDAADPAALVHDPVATIRWTTPTTLVIGGSGGRAGAGPTWEMIDAVTGARRPLTAEEISGLAARRLAPRPCRSRDDGGDTAILFRNDRDEPVSIVWIDRGGDRHAYGRLEPGTQRRQHTFAGHAWLVCTASGAPLGWMRAEAGPIEVTIDPQLQPLPDDGAEAPTATAESPAPDDNPSLPAAAAALGGPFAWSPDRRHVVAWEIVPAQRHPVHLVESAPRDRVEPKLVTLDYLKPGDRIEQRWPRLFASDGRELPLDRGLFANPWSNDRLRWRADGRGFTFLHNRRGHQTVRLLAVDVPSGTVRTVVEETSPTFVDYAHKTWLHWLSDDELLWMSERDGWNHLWLVDVPTGTVRRQVTEGRWMVRRVERVDEQGRTITLVALGLDPAEDPYHEHVIRVPIDGGPTVRLTHGDGTHRLTWSPDRRWYVDTHSRVDLPPVHALRRADDGGLVCDLGRADASALVATGWTWPERFVAEGRDGRTGIHGVIFRPRGTADDGAPRPVVEDIYAGPHGFHVPKAFAAAHRARRLADEGFVVVMVDGMGTNWRGKAFHDVCWKNLHDAGLPDRIAWLRAAAAERPWMDLSRVGIVGGSAGGQNALRALLDHPDVYHVAVADCGCHDNRMDKIWWNELWMGWPVDEAYERASNVVAAGRLEGRLMLIVGALDRNVDPASTLQVSAALVRAGRDHELVVLPDAGHGAAETPYGSQKRLAFLKRHLLDARDAPVPIGLTPEPAAAP
jgi:dipeptidyl-peptidase-4